MKIVNCSIYDTDEKYDIVRSDPCRVISCKMLDDNLKMCFNGLCQKMLITEIYVDSSVPKFISLKLVK